MSAVSGIIVVIILAVIVAYIIVKLKDHIRNASHLGSPPPPPPPNIVHLHSPPTPTSSSSSAADNETQGRFERGDSNDTNETSVSDIHHLFNNAELNHHQGEETTVEESNDSSGFASGGQQQQQSSESLPLPSGMINSAFVGDDFDTPHENENFTGRPSSLASDLKSKLDSVRQQGFVRKTSDLPKPLISAVVGPEIGKLSDDEAGSYLNSLMNMSPQTSRQAYKITQETSK